VKLKAIVHKAEEGGYWAEVPAIPGCVTQGETLAELRANIREAIQGCLSVDLDTLARQSTDRLVEVAV
jgi:predicted RNase H-like HicB family nuclease